MTRRELYDTYLPAFKKLVTEAKVELVMGAYNRTLDELCCASKLLIEDILRGEWDFQGPPSQLLGTVRFSPQPQGHERRGETVALALHHGCDLGCDHVFSEIPEAIARGLIAETDVDRALERTLATRFKLGMFDPPQDVLFASISTDVVACEAHRQLAYRTATEAVVLLKNKDNILPIKPSTKKILCHGTHCHEHGSFARQR